ncbi:hypothetical protein LV75_005556 [Actinokineospora diospyrosa]|uniref:Uncharacterized protein n=2 Tax=Actinokineospora diospyrosa TaxID=103728 RepID=A0ABT1IK45_9PSEU|nr:hypothetical protein [Actinokineospora diospyrosa]
MRRALTVIALLLACASCKDTSNSPTPSNGSIEQELTGIESTLDNVESELAGD